MTSETQIAQGSRVRRHGRSRAFCRYQRSSDARCRGLNRGRRSSEFMGTREQARAEFERMVQQPEPMLDLAHTALLIAAENDPQVDVNAELECIEGWAAELK